MMSPKAAAQSTPDRLTLNFLGLKYGAGLQIAPIDGGAGGRGRTGTGLPPTDFKSAASTVNYLIYNTFMLFLNVYV